MQPRTRGRFFVEPLVEGWNLVDGKWGATVSFDTKREALETKSFAITYVKRWGDINFFRFPYSLDDAPVPVTEEDTGEWPDAPRWGIGGLRCCLK